MRKEGFFMKKTWQDWPIAVMAVNLALCAALLMAVLFDHSVPPRCTPYVPTLRVEELRD